MAIPKTRSPKFKWEKYNLEELKKEYYEIWLYPFVEKYKTGRHKVLNMLWVIPEEIQKELQRKKRKVVATRVMKWKIERLENTTKVARMYEKQLTEHISPKYEWPFASYFNKKF